MKHLDVCCGILINDHQVLCVQRGIGKHDYVSFKWEFPGGKLEIGEKAKQALHRELLEELDIDIDENNMIYFRTVNHQYPDFEISLYCYICNVTFKTVNLLEHIDMKWVTIDTIFALNWAAADLEAVNALVEIDIKDGDSHGIQSWIKNWTGNNESGTV